MEYRLGVLRPVQSNDDCLPFPRELPWDIECEGALKISKEFLSWDQSRQMSKDSYVRERIGK